MNDTAGTDWKDHAAARIAEAELGVDDFATRHGLSGAHREYVRFMMALHTGIMCAGHPITRLLAATSGANPEPAAVGFAERMGITNKEAFLLGFRGQWDGWRSAPLPQAG